MKNITNPTKMILFGFLARIILLLGNVTFACTKAFERAEYKAVEEGWI